MRPVPSIHPYDSPYPQSPHPQRKGCYAICAFCSMMMYIFCAFLWITGVAFTVRNEQRGHIGLIAGLLSFAMGAPFLVFGTCCCYYMKRERSRLRKHKNENYLIDQRIDVIEMQSAKQIHSLGSNTYINRNSGTV